MDYNQDLTADLGLIDDILRAIRDGECVALKRAEAELRTLRATLVRTAPTSRQSVSDQVALLLNREPAFAMEARRVVAKTAMRFIETQMEYYSGLALERELTEDEKRFGRESLGPLIDSLRTLFDPDDK